LRNLGKRLSALEQVAPLNIGPIFIRFVSNSNQGHEVVRIVKGSYVWDRQPDESEQDLKCRSIREAPPPMARCANLFFLTTSQH
jgi:hypothetical protein